MKRWRKDTQVAKEEKVETPEANTPKQPTRAEQLFALFEQLKVDFEYEGLQGIWIDTGNEQAISITHKDRSILWVARDWWLNCYALGVGKAWGTLRTLVFNEEFDCQLNMYMTALEQAVEQKQRKDDLLQQKAKERIEFEVSRF